jgi:hypothetical protein
MKTLQKSKEDLALFNIIFNQMLEKKNKSDNLIVKGCRGNISFQKQHKMLIPRCSDKLRAGGLSDADHPAF